MAHSIPAQAEIAAKPDDFEVWLSQRHKWLQTAAHWLIQSKAPASEAELAALTGLCLGEVGAAGEHTFTAVTPGALVQAAVRPPLRIKGLSEIRGVNRIRDQAALSFGTGNLAVIYGANGSGKTGFSRLMKQICGSRAREDIHPNVFDKAATACAAKISAVIGKDSTDFEWTLAGGPLPPLRDVHVFDSKTASNYVVSQNEARYEPSRMRFVSALIRTCDRVSERLAAQKIGLVKKLPLFPPAFAQTNGAKWLLALRATATPIDLDNGCSYSAKDEEERISTEGVLAQKDIVGRLEAIAREQASLLPIRATLSALQDGFSDEKLDVLLSARNEAIAKRKAAQEAAQQVFATAPLEGVGQKTWMALWEQARIFSQQHAYPSHPFPKVDGAAHCVLCQQPLDDNAKARLSHFEAFVIGGLEETAKAAEKKYLELQKRLPLVPQEKDWAVLTGVLKLEEDYARMVLATITTRSSVALTAVALEDIPVVEWTDINDIHAKATNALIEEAKSLKELQGDGKRKQLETRVLELNAAQWLNQNKVAVIEEVERLKALALIDKAVALTNTSALTRKHTELAKDDLYKGYQDRFAAELKQLGGNRLPVKPESKQAGKGKITFGLQLQGLQRVLAAEQVLSEGETRVVALAAFLADISGLAHQSPFIFDDPISSLDQDFEEKVVRRIVELSKTRQVIVFTHRLSLLTLIESEVKKLKEETDLAKLPPSVELHIQSVCSFGKDAGVVRDMGIRDLKPKSAINRMRDEQVSQLRKLFDAGDVAEYDARANGVCSDLRILVERSVESILLNDVLVRFRRSLQTQGRIGALAKITPADCALIDDLMTRYSVFEHSQSDELPAARPDIAEIESDVAKMAAWIEDFSKRAVG